MPKRNEEAQKNNKLPLSKHQSSFVLYEIMKQLFDLYIYLQLFPGTSWQIPLPPSRRQTKPTVRRSSPTLHRSLRTSANQDLRMAPLSRRNQQKTLKLQAWPARHKRGANQGTALRLLPGRLSRWPSVWERRPGNEVTIPLNRRTLTRCRETLIWSMDQTLKTRPETLRSISTDQYQMLFVRDESMGDGLTFSW